MILMSPLNVTISLLHFLSHINRGWLFSRVFRTSCPSRMGCGCCPRCTHWTASLWDPSRSTIIHGVLWLSLSVIICEHFIFPIPNSRRVKTILKSADYDMRRKIENVVSTFTSRDQDWEESWRVCFWPSYNIDVFLWRSSSSRWLMDMIWCRYLTPSANHSGVGPPIASPTLVRPMMYFPTDGCFSAARRNHCWYAIMINESSVVPDDYMSLDGIGGALVPLNDPGFLRPGILFYREGHSYEAHLWPHECHESYLKMNRIFLLCMAVGMSSNL